MGWEDILPAQKAKIEKFTGAFYEDKECKEYNQARGECLTALRQAEKEGKVCINPPSVSELDMMIRGNVMYNYTHAKVGDNMAVFYADQLAQAISERIRRR